MEFPQALFGNAEVALSSASALGCGFAEGRGYKPFFLQALEGGIDAAQRDAAMWLELASNRNTIGSFAETDEGEENHQFKLAEIAAVGHFFDDSE